MSVGVYRSLLRLYPRSFRDEFGDDLSQLFGDLAADRGTRAAWTRAGTDLIVTVPRYRLEQIMTEQQSTTAVSATIAVLAIGGAMSLLGGLYPGVLLLVAAVALALAQRSRLSQAICTPNSNLRRRRLITAGVLGVIAIGALISYAQELDDEHIGSTSLLLHNAVGIPAIIGTIGFVIAGMVTPRSAEDGGVASKV